MVSDSKMEKPDAPHQEPGQKKFQKADLLLSMVSHEMRTPLTVLLYNIANIKDGLHGKFLPHQMKIIKTIDEHVQHLNRIVSNILDLSRMESGKAKMVRSKFLITKLVKKALGECEKIKNKEIQLVNSIPKNFPQIWADKDMIHGLLTNLVNNAVRFAKKQVRIHGRILAKNKKIQISVFNDGPEIAPEDQKRIFNKFEQIKRTKEKNGYKGTGLGLPICKEIVENHRGSIFVESAKNKGTSFHFILPIELRNTKR